MFPTARTSMSKRHGLLCAAGCLLLLLVSAGCATRTPTPAGSQPVVRSAPASPEAASLIRTARVLVGYPYQWGGESPDAGFDCSGLVWFVYRQHGISVPRISYQQFNVGSPVQRKDIRPGDLVFYRVDKSGKTLHVGIVTDRATFIHAPSSGKRVMESSLNLPYWSAHYLGARRVL